MIEKAKLHAFGFPDDPIPPTPTQMRSRIVLGGTINTMAAGALVASSLLTLLLGIAVMRKADSLPFVADGGIAGCQATTVRE